MGLRDTYLSASLRPQNGSTRWRLAHMFTQGSGLGAQPVPRDRRLA